MNNTVKTILLLGLLGLLVIGVGGVIGGKAGLVAAFALALLFNGGAYLYSDKIALAAAGAKPLRESEAPNLYKMVARLARRSGLAMPKLYITPSRQANAFATGRNPENASLAVTSGLLKLLPDAEIRGVLAHEMSHIKNRDILLTSVAAVLASSVSFLANMGMWGAWGGDNNNSGDAGIAGLLIMLLAPLGAMLLQLAVSREREYEADRSGAVMLGSGIPLANALTDIGRSTRQLPEGAANPAFATLYIASPWGGSGRNIVKLFSTHPPLEERIARLRNLYIG